MLLDPGSLPSSSVFSSRDLSIQRSNSERRPSESRLRANFRDRDAENPLDVEANECWLDLTAREILETRDDMQARLVSGTTLTEEAVDVSKRRGRH